MKIKVNRNIVWTETFTAALANAGVKDACISPGSRSTPLTFALAVNRKINSHVIVDERSSGFFALGLAKATNKPVVIVCTSGTAVAELYPAIIESYQSKVPLIVCTADRSPEILNTGANQTINQNNIYKNHIRWFADAGLPQLNKNKLNYIKQIARRALVECSIKNIGPVHINFPFKEPFEPTAFTDEITQHDLKIIKSIPKFSLSQVLTKKPIKKKTLQSISNKIINRPKGIILVGLDNYSKGFFTACNQLSVKTGYPILADAASNMRFSTHSAQNVLTNYDSYLRSEKFVLDHKPSLLIQFGRNFSSKALSNFIAECSCEKILVNKFGNWKNPKDRSTSIIAADPEIFCKALLSFNKKKPLIWNEWVSERLLTENDFIYMDKSASKVKSKIFAKAQFPNETRIVQELIASIPDGSNIMVSNSLPIRDLDLILPLMKKNLTIYHNRGASGIDGIISTALGIAKESISKTFLLIGDLAFYYDLNSLLIAQKNSIPLTIILVNNNGGRIFEALPISKQKNIFEEYFATPHNLNFSKFVSAFGGNYFEVKSWSGFRKKLKQSNTENNFSVLEIKTDPKKSLSLRRAYFNKVISSYNQKSRD